MAITNDSPSRTAANTPGIFTRIVARASGLYVVFMVCYLILRLTLGERFWWLALLNSFAIYTLLPLAVLLPAAMVSHAWRYVTRLGFLALLAVFWFGPLFQPSGTVRPAGGLQLRVVTFNLHGDRNEALEAVDTWLREIDADIVLIQERPTVYAEEGLPALLDIYPTQSDQQVTRLYLLSKHPTELTDSDTRWTRSVVHVDGQDIAVYNVHFIYPFLDKGRFGLGKNILGWVASYDETERNQQIDDLLEYLESETLPYLVAGDFNASQHSMVYGSIVLALNDSFRKTASGLGSTWPAYFPVLRLDYVLYDNTFQALHSYRGPSGLGSDHLPVVADLELLPTALTQDAR